MATKSLLLRGGRETWQCTTWPQCSYTVDVNGNAQRLSDQAGKVVLVNIWATWCGPRKNRLQKCAA